MTVLIASLFSFLFFVQYLLYRVFALATFLLLASAISFIAEIREIASIKDPELTIALI